MSADSAMPAAAGPTGTIHDLGYRRYDGPRLGAGYAMRSLYVHSLRGAYGIGRGAKAKILPFLLFGIMCVPAVVAAVIRSRTGETTIRYDAYPFVMGLVIVIFLAAQGPEMLSRDLRHKVLPLYFSRPAGRSDYALAKLGALTTAVFALMAPPLLIMYLGALLDGNEGLHQFASESRAFALGLANAAVHAVVLAAVAALVASLSGRRVYATGMVVGLFFVTTTLSGVVQGVGGTTAQRLAGLITPFNTLEGFKQWVLRGKPAGEIDIGSYGPLYALATVLLFAVASGLLLLRYRKVAA